MRRQVRRSRFGVRSIAVTGLLLMLLGCDQGPPRTSGSDPALVLPAGTLDAPDTPFLHVLTTPLPAGVVVRSIGSELHALLVAELDADQLRPELVAQPNTGIAPVDALIAGQFDILIGSGFVTDSRSMTPVGLLQSAGAILSPVQDHGYTRILGLADGQLEVVHRRAFAATRFASALQVGPGIVERGELDISEKDLQRPRYFRSFVAVCGQRWLVGISLYPTNLHTLGQTLLKDIRARGYQCADVVNLAGDRQAVLLVKTADGRVFHHGDPSAPKVSMLGFRSK